MPWRLDFYAGSGVLTSGPRVCVASIGVHVCVCVIVGDMFYVFVCVCEMRYVCMWCVGRVFVFVWR